MDSVEVFGYQIEYPYLSLSLLKSEPKEYHIALFYIVLEEGQKGFGFTRINKAKKNGTEIRYRAFKSEKEADRFTEKIVNMAEDLNQKYGAGIKLKKIEGE